MREVDASRTSRADAVIWLDAPMPMITIFKTLDVARLVKASRRKGCKFNLLMCWCIGRAAARVEEFYLLPVGRKLVQFEHIAVNTVVATEGGGISTCDIPFRGDFRQFRQDYLRLTEKVSASGKPYDLGEDYMVVGTSALAQYDIDGAVNIYAGCYNNPFLIWGKYRKKWLRTTLPVSFQFHHTQMDGVHAARFLENLQEEINHLQI